MDNIHYLFTSESVSEGHPDKLCDQIADRILDAYLEANKNSFVAIECFATTDTLIIGGEVNPINENIDIEKIARDTIKSIGYDKDEYGFNYKIICYKIKKFSFENFLLSCCNNCSYIIIIISYCN